MKRLNALLRSFRNMKVQVQCNIIYVEYYNDGFVQPLMKHLVTLSVWSVHDRLSVCSGACRWKNITKPSFHELIVIHGLQKKELKKKQKQTNKTKEVVIEMSCNCTCDA